jgi:hypothetical protein
MRNEFRQGEHLHQCQAMWPWQKKFCQSKSDPGIFILGGITHPSSFRIDIWLVQNSISMHEKGILTGGTPSPMKGLVTLTKEILPVQVQSQNLHLRGNHASIVLRDWDLTCTELNKCTWEMNFDRGNTFTNVRQCDPDKRNFASPSPTSESSS